MTTTEKQAGQHWFYFHAGEWCTGKLYAVGTSLYIEGLHAEDVEFGYQIHPPDGPPGDARRVFNEGDYREALNTIGEELGLRGTFHLISDVQDALARLKHAFELKHGTTPMVVSLLTQLEQEMSKHLEAGAAVLDATQAILRAKSEVPR